jgi:dienelactone hydrolase
LPGTQLLQADEPLDVMMVNGIDRFALREIKAAAENRDQLWHRDYSSVADYGASIGPNRDRFRRIIGAVDQRTPARGLEFIATTTQDSLVAENRLFSIHAVRWPVLKGVTAEGLFLQPTGRPIARVIALPDADWTPEMIAGLDDCQSQFAAQLAALGCEVLVPTLINRDAKFSRNDTIGRATNLTHREFIYRQAFELGRHIIGYEVQKVLAAVDQFALRNTADSSDLPIAVMGVSEGGLLALYSGALDDRIDATVVSGYFNRRDDLWREPIYRNVWKLLTEFGDADIASMIAPRLLYIEHNPAIPEIAGPPQTTGRNIAAPGAILRPQQAAVSAEINLAQQHWDELAKSGDRQVKSLLSSDAAGAAPLGIAVTSQALKYLGQLVSDDLKLPAMGPDRRQDFSADRRQARQVSELVDFTQHLLRNSYRARDARFAKLDRSDLDKCVASMRPLREQVYNELFGKLPAPTISPNPRTRLVLQDDHYVGYEVMLDVYPDVIAAGILLLPRDLKTGEKRPVVVCQHGLEGTPTDTISGPDSPGYRAYKSFSAELVKRGFIVYAPQNPYRGRDAFRTLQRKSNPLGRSLFSYIIPQHLVTLRWLASLANVDQDRIGFYGLSYGGKTAVRVPPMLPPTADEPGYCLSICSADYNEWVAKNASTDAPFSYIWTGEYEIFEWNMGHVANYAELSMLMTPRPFMVERGHDDGVGIDEWVAWEYAKVRRHYNKLGIGERTEIEFFNGPHTINGKGTYDFLHRHLHWPK